MGHENLKIKRSPKRTSITVRLIDYNYLTNITKSPKKLIMIIGLFHFWLSSTELNDKIYSKSEDFKQLNKKDKKELILYSNDETFKSNNLERFTSDSRLLIGWLRGVFRNTKFLDYIKEIYPTCPEKIDLSSLTINQNNQSQTTN
jgi:hypothetical protein